MSVVSSVEFSVSTPAREALVDITGRVQRIVDETYPGVDGLVNIFVPHTTAAVTINEGADPSVARDIIEALARLVPRDGGYRHAEGNSDAHIKASILGSNVGVPIEKGRLRLGTWQAIYLAEFDGPRTRRVWITPVTSVGLGSP
jgi:secondary thiamine-phosphate synthase enzyme